MGPLGRPSPGGSETQLLGLLMLTLYVVADSFTSQWQSRVYREHPTVDQFQARLMPNPIPNPSPNLNPPSLTPTPQA